jgi:tRNA pseudouridine55 synthase
MSSINSTIANLSPVLQPNASPTDFAEWFGSVAEKGGILPINKEYGWTSFDVVRKISGMLRLKKIGHAGTLDPLATGLLLLCLGKATKQIEQLQNTNKVYEMTVKLGATTPSYDAETEEQNHASLGHLTNEEIRAVLQSFVGTITQIPPVYSALKHKGKPLYEYARENKEVEVKSRQVTIFDIHSVNIDLPFVQCTIVCTKGTYIRSLAHDIGNKLGVGGYLSALCRKASGELSLSSALAVNTISDLATRSGLIQTSNKSASTEAHGKFVHKKNIQPKAGVHRSGQSENENITAVLQSE